MISAQTEYEHSHSPQGSWAGAVPWKARTGGVTPRGNRGAIRARGEPCSQKNRGRAGNPCCIGPGMAAGTTIRSGTYAHLRGGVGRPGGRSPKVKPVWSLPFTESGSSFPGGGCCPRLGGGFPFMEAPWKKVPGMTGRRGTL